MYRVISPYCRIIPRCCGPTEILRMMGKVANEPPIMDVYSYMCTRPYFLGRNPSGDIELWNPQMEFFGFSSLSSFLIPSPSPKAQPAAFKALPDTFVILSALSVSVKPFQLPLRPVQLPLRPFQRPLRLSQRPLWPSQLHLKPSKVPEALPAVSETHCLKCPLHSFNCLWGSLQLNRRPLLCPLSLFCSGHCSLLCFRFSLEPYGFDNVCFFQHNF